MATDRTAHAEIDGTYAVTARAVGLEEVGPRNVDGGGAAGGPHAFRVDFGEAIPLDTLPDTFDVELQVALPEGLGVRLRHPRLALHVTDADQDGVFVVTDDFSTVYGEGGDPGTAIGDYLGSLLARFLDLEEQEAILGPGLQSDLAALRRHITRP